MAGQRKKDVFTVTIKVDNTDEERDRVKDAETWVTSLKEIDGLSVSQGDDCLVVETSSGNRYNILRHNLMGFRPQWMTEVNLFPSEGSEYPDETLE